MLGRLSALQVTILSTLAEVQPPWVLVGLAPPEVADLVAFRDLLVERLLRLAVSS